MDGPHSVLLAGLSARPVLKRKKGQLFVKFVRLHSHDLSFFGYTLGFLYIGFVTVMDPNMFVTFNLLLGIVECVCTNFGTGIISQQYLEPHRRGDLHRQRGPA